MDAKILTISRRNKVDGKATTSKATNNQPSAPKEAPKNSGARPKGNGKHSRRESDSWGRRIQRKQAVELVPNAI